MIQILNASELSHSFGGKRLFKNISFGVFTNDRIGLIGPNGAGKSTLLKILVKQLEPDQGTITTNKGLRIGYLEQTPVFADGATLFDAVQMGNRSDHPVEDADVWEWLNKLELTQYSPDQIVNELSGGWKKRVALARELCRQPDLLLLDEPTNHLDIQGILWLEEFIQKTKMALLTVTHDRLFLQRVSNKIFDLDPRNPQGLLKIDGGYTQFLEAKELLMASEKHRECTLKNTLRRETEWLRRGAQARQTKQKARIDSAESLGQTVQELSARNRDRKVELSFEAASAVPKKLIEVKELSLVRNKEGEEQTLFKNLNLLLGRGSRVGLLGPNGCGKSSLIRILLQQELPTSGVVHYADQIQVAHFEQDKNSLNLNASVLENICPFGDFVQLNGKPLHVNSYLERFLFRPDQGQLPARQLSGGEQARLRLAQLMLLPASLLILDEPTNDLDMETLQVLENSIRDFSGAVILVTHDRYFMDQVCSEILAFPIAWGDSSGKLVRFADYFQFEAQLQDASSEKNKPEPSAKSSESASVAPATAQKPSKSALSQKEQRMLAQIETTIAEKESLLAKLEQEITQTQERTQLASLTSEHQACQNELEKLMQSWSELSAKSKC